MWGIVVSALGSVVSWFFGAATIKWALGALILYGFASLLELALSLLPAWFSASSLGSGASVFSPEVWYFVDYFGVEYGISLTLSAYIARFLIRRIPFIG